VLKEHQQENSEKGGGTIMLCHMGWSCQISRTGFKSKRREYGSARQHVVAVPNL